MVYLIRLLIILVLLLVAGCGSFKPLPPQEEVYRDNIHVKSREGLTVSTTLLPDEQSRRLFGVDLADVGLQAIWLRIENRSERSYWLLVAGMDPSYFPPDEAAVLFYPGLGKSDEERLTRHFRELAMPLKTSAGATSEGYVLAPRHEGGRFINVTLVGDRDAIHFGFAVPLPDGDFDFESLDPAAIYGNAHRPDLDLDELRARVRLLPCCTTDETGQEAGDPLNLVLIGDTADILAGLSRGGWSYTHRINLGTIRRMIGAAISGSAYPVAPVSPLYFLERPQDLALQRARNNILQRNHLRLWLAPFRYQGRSVWVGQVSRDIGVKATWLSPTFTTHVIDPNIDEAREHLLQSLLAAGVVEWFGFAAGIPPASAENPGRNLTQDIYFTDGLRLVAEMSGTRTIPLDNVEFLDWRDSPDPMLRGKASPDGE